MTDKPTKYPSRTDTHLLPWVLVIAALLVGAVVWVSQHFKPVRHPANPEKVMSITLSPPPPPPPLVDQPPPKEERPVVEEIIIQESVSEDKPAAEDLPPDLPAGPDLGAGSMGGTGPAIGGSGGNGKRIGANRRSIGTFGGFATKVQSSIREALANHPSTRSATMNLEIKLWADVSGRIRRARLVGSSGIAAVDQAICNEVLIGIQLPQPPPADMPMPIHLHIAARTPNP